MPPHDGQHPDKREQVGNRSLFPDKGNDVIIENGLQEVIPCDTRAGVDQNQDKDDCQQPFLADI